MISVVLMVAFNTILCAALILGLFGIMGDVKPRH